MSIPRNRRQQPWRQQRVPQQPFIQQPASPTLPTSFEDDSTSPRAILVLCQHATAQQEEISRRIQALAQIRTLRGPLHAATLSKNLDSVLASLGSLLSERSDVLRSGACATLVSLWPLLAFSSPKQSVQAPSSTEPVASHFFKWLFQILNSHSSSTAKKLHTLDVLQQVCVLPFTSVTRHKITQIEEISTLEQYIPLVMLNITSFLENVTEPEVLPFVLPLVRQIAQSFPAGFAPHFEVLSCIVLFNIQQDVIDVLVGWQVDIELPEITSVQISGFFFSFCLAKS